MSENMADKLKRKLSAKNVTAMILFGAIILVFVFFGMPDRLGAGMGSVAQVNNTLISLADFQQEENRIQQYYQNLFGNQMDFSPQRQLLRQQALENLVRMELVYQVAQDEGIVVTDAEVRDFIVKDIPFFQQNGMFQRDLYGRYLESTRMKPSDFESKVRKDVANVRTHHLFEIAAKPSSLELAKMNSLREQKINVGFVKIDQDAIAKKLSKEQIENSIKALDEALVKGDETAAEGQIKVLGATWEETGFTELTGDSFPKLTSRAAIEGVNELTSAQPLLKRLVRDGNFKFVLKLKGYKVEPSKEPMTTVAIEMVQKRRGEGMFEAWINQFRKESKVTMNTQALQLN